MHLTMDPQVVTLTAQIKRDFERLTMLLIQQEKKILELEQSEVYYKNRMTHLEADLIDMAEKYEKLESKN
jgi:hypothetical protein